MEASIPFGREVYEKGWAPLFPETDLTFRGLWASSLRMHVGDIRPFLRWLQAEIAKNFPCEADGVLKYFAIGLDEGSSRSSFRSLVMALGDIEP